MEMFFWCASGEDGTSIQPMSRGELERRLALLHAEEPDVVFLDSIPDSDKGCWNADERAVVIIKGEIAVPKAVKTVTKYSV